eukprot:GHVL01002934.1.p1 GENE.GHVL01002934.1~~GHVL01002934.1.p1  ORF type:complete len:115 (-),score=28.30 GHVL01002934.1:688-1032(-)
MASLESDSPRQAHDSNDGKTEQFVDDDDKKKDNKWETAKDSRAPSKIKSLLSLGDSLQSFSSQKKAAQNDNMFDSVNKSKSIINDYETFPISLLEMRSTLKRNLKHHLQSTLQY